jgi:uncharacterized protein (TIGR02466 family)
VPSQRGLGLSRSSHQPKRSGRIPPMPIQTLFPTYLYAAPLQRNDGRKLNKQLLRECLQLPFDDEAGVKWSLKNYPGGYTSYQSAHRMQQVSPTFAQLEKHVRRHVKSFVKTLELDMTGRELEMTDCWVNIMPRQVAHSMHLHPLSTISGTYYVQTPKGCAGLKFEDPRLEKFMAAPPRRADASPANRPWAVVPAEAGKVVLFESWLRHEVPANSPSLCKGRRQFSQHAMHELHADRAFTDA